MNFLTKEMVWRDNETFGLNCTPPHNPVKAEIIAYLGQLEIGKALGAVLVKTKAELYTITNRENYTPGIVGADPDQALSGYYQWLDGAWHYVRDLADSITRLIDVGGTANAITAGLRLGVSVSALEFVVFVPVANNTGAVTITVGGVTLPVRNGLGAELDPDDLQTGFPAMLAVIEGQEGYVLLNEANVAAVVLTAKAAAIDAKNEAQAAKAAAEAALDNLEEAVAQASELAFERFNKLYLGPFDEDPVSDNKGDDLIDGALYFNVPDKKLKMFTSDGWKLATPDTSDFLSKANNLSDLPSKSAARANLGLGRLAVQDIIDPIEIRDSAVTEPKLAARSVTDAKLNSETLNTLAVNPRIIAAASVDASGTVLWGSNLTCKGAGTGTYQYTFIQPLPSSKAGKFVVLTTAGAGGRIPVTNSKTKDGFKTGFSKWLRPSHPYFEKSNTAHDVVVIGVW